MIPRSPRSLLPRLSSRRLLLEVKSVERSQQQCEVRLQPSNLQERGWLKENASLTIPPGPPDLSLQCFKCTKSTGLMNLEQFCVLMVILFPFSDENIFSSLLDCADQISNSSLWIDFSQILCLSPNFPKTQCYITLLFCGERKSSMYLYTTKR